MSSSSSYSDYQSALKWAHRRCSGSSEKPPEDPQGINWFWVILILVLLILGGWWWWLNYGGKSKDCSEETTCSETDACAVFQ